MPALASGTEPSSSAARLSRRFPSQLRCKNVVLLPRAGPRTSRGLGSSPFARHYWGNHCCFLFLEVLRCFSSLRSPPRPVPGMTALQAAGLSHSETRGSKVICTSPRIIAAYRVLHRLHEPRHPPCALSYFPRYRTPHQQGREPELILSAVLLKKNVSLSTVLLVQHVKDLAGCRKPRVENIGLEPMTSCMPCKRSSQLS